MFIRTYIHACVHTYIHTQMNMSGHVSKVIKSANYHLRNFGKIIKFLNTDTTKSVIVSLVT